MLRMTGETGMQYFFYTAFKEFPHGKRILALLLRTQGERFHPLQHDPGIKGAECRASVAMKWQQHIFDEIFRTAHGSGKHPALPIHQLGGRSEERRVGKESVCTCRYWGSPVT